MFLYQWLKAVSIRSCAGELGVVSKAECMQIDPEEGSAGELGIVSRAEDIIQIDPEVVCATQCGVKRKAEESVAINTEEVCGTQSGVKKRAEGSNAIDPENLNSNADFFLTPQRQPMVRRKRPLTVTPSPVPAKKAARSTKSNQRSTKKL